MTNVEKLISRMGWLPIDENTPRDRKIIVTGSTWSEPDIVEWEESTKIVDGVEDKSIGYWVGSDINYGVDEPELWANFPTGKEGEIMRVMVDALEEIADGSRNFDGDYTHCANEALAKAEELAGKV